MMDKCRGALPLHAITACNRGAPPPLRIDAQQIGMTDV